MKKLKLVPNVTMLLALLLATAGTVLADTPGFQQQHHQYRNGENKEEWTKGAINFINSDYAEDDSVPYRYEFKDVQAGACIQMEIHYDFSRGSGPNKKYAFDFLTNVKRTETTIDLFSSPNTPLTGLSELTDCNFSALQIPDDPAHTYDDALAPQHFTLCGNYNSGATETYVRSSEPGESTKGQNTEKSIELQIRAGGTGGEVVDLAIAWGGHLADEDDWGAGKGAGSISGAPYHMRGNGFLDVNCDGEFTNGVDRHFDDGDRAIQIRELDEEELGTITIVKDAEPNDPQDFQFIGELGDFFLDDDDDDTLPNSQTFAGLLQDTYEVKEKVPDGWKLDHVACTKEGQGGPPNDDYWVFDDENDTVSITLGPGEEITCIFTNKPEGGNAITLASFTARAGVGAVTLAWETGTEVDNAGFNLYRASSPAGPYTKVNGALIAAQGDAVGGASYSYVDTPGGHGTFYYKLEDVDLNGVATQHGPVPATVMPRFRRPVYRPMWPRF